MYNKLKISALISSLTVLFTVGVSGAATITPIPGGAGVFWPDVQAIIEGNDNSLNSENATQQTAIDLNTAKTGITAQQSSDITTNNAKVSFPEAPITSIQYVRFNGAWMESSGWPTLMTELDATAWRVFYSNGTGDVTELTLGANGTFLMSNGATSAPSFSTPAGSGDVVGPASSVNNSLAAFDGTTGKLIEDSGITRSGNDFTFPGRVITTAADMFRSVELEENTSFTPTAGKVELYNEAGEFKKGVNGVEDTVAGLSDLPTIISGSEALGTVSIASGACATTVTDTATGAATTDVVAITWASSPTGVTGYAPSASGGLYINVWPTANQVNLSVCNNTDGAIVPGAMTINWQIIK